MKLTHTFFLSALFFIASSANAAIIQTFTDRSAWESAVGIGNFQTETFNTDDFFGTPIPHNVATNADVVSGNGLFDVFYTTANGSNNSNNQIENSSATAAGGLRVDDFLYLQYTTFGPSQTEIMQFQVSNAPVNAFGGNFINLGNVGLTASIGNGSTDTVNVGPSNSGFEGFFGFVSDSPFSTIDFKASSGNDVFLVDNVSLGTTTAVPVPGALWLLGSGLLGWIGFRKSSC